ncbi:uncharacterized protein V6R79_000240 [Siganus canaliculatus]
MALEQHLDLIKNMIQNGKTCTEISCTSVSMGLDRGTSVSNLKKICSKWNLRKNGLVSSTQLEGAIVKAVQETGQTYGRRMMCGYLKSKGVHAAEHRVGAALHAVQPEAHDSRCNGLRNLNPVPYNAAYFGQKIHIDQNEKMVMYGVTYVIAIYGYSKKIVASAVMPVKNNLI